MPRRDIQNSDTAYGTSLADKLKSKPELDKIKPVKPVEPVETPKAPEPTKTTTKVTETKYTEPKSEAVKFLQAELKKEDAAFQKLKAPTQTAVEARNKILADLKTARDDRQDMLGWAQIAERALGAITKYAAAKEGLSRGLDMSNADIERTDWDKLIDRTMDQYDRDLSNISGRFAKEDAALADYSGQVAASEKRRFDLMRDIAKLRDARAQRIATMQKEDKERFKPTKFEEELQKGLAKDLTVWNKKGRYDTQEKLAGLEKAEELLNQLDGSDFAMITADLTGHNAGAILSNLGQMTGLGGEDVGKAAEALRLVERAMQADIGRVLDSQFAAREADQVLRRGFPKGSPEVKKKALKDMIEVLDDYYKEQEALSEYMRKNSRVDPEGMYFRSPFREKYQNRSEDVQSVEVTTPEESPMSEDDQARAWAEANPDDPRAKKILEMLGK